MKVESIMSHDSSAPECESEAAHWRENPTAPVRILVSTATHLVPGDGFLERTEFISNAISQHHWKCDMDWKADRFMSYYADFAYDNRTCYFVVDHGRIPSEDVPVPILWYRWTGDSLQVPSYDTSCHLANM